MIVLKTTVKLVGYIIFLLALMWPSLTHCHKDREITIGTDGKLEGLPKEYGPSYLKISRTSGSEIPKVVLRLGTKAVHIPPCIAKLFILPKGEEVDIGASWYHNLSILPPYIHIILPTQTYSEGFIDGYELLFNLQTAELISITKTTVSPDHISYENKEIFPSSLCNTDELNEIQPQSISR